MNSFTPTCLVCVWLKGSNSKKLESKGQNEYPCPWFFPFRNAMHWLSPQPKEFLLHVIFPLQLWWQLPSLLFQHSETHPKNWEQQALGKNICLPLKSLEIRTVIPHFSVSPKAKPFSLVAGKMDHVSKDYSEVNFAVHLLFAGFILPASSWKYIFCSLSLFKKNKKKTKIFLSLCRQDEILWTSLDHLPIC